jgi:hypothetical protein
MQMSNQLADTGYYLSNHAVHRAQERGIRHEIIAFIIRNAESSLFVGDNRFSVRIRDEEHNRLKSEGVPPTFLEKCKNIVLVVSSMEPTVITVLRDYGTKRGRCHRKQMPTKCLKRR